MFWMYHDDHFYDKVNQAYRTPTHVRKTSRSNKIKRFEQFERELDKHFGRSNTLNTYKEQSHNTLLKRIFYTHEVMSKNLITLQPEQPIEDAKSTFKQKHIRHIPVIDGEGSLVGILSDRDVFIVEEKNTIAEVMTKNVIVCEKNTPIRRVAEMMFYKKIGAIPVVDAEHELCGIISRSDILRALINFGKIELWM